MPDQPRFPALTAAGLACVASIAVARAGEQGHPCASISGDGARLACYDEAFGRPAGSETGARGAGTAAGATTGVAAGSKAMVPPASAAAVTAAATSTRAVAVESPSAATATAVPRADAEADFGLTEADKRALDPERAEKSQLTSIRGTVASVARRPTKELVVTLENGQVWVQSESVTHVTLKVGDVVTIRKASLGSHMLVAPNRAAMRVRRIR